MRKLLGQDLDIQCSSWLAGIAPSQDPLEGSGSRTMTVKFYSSRAVNTSLVVGCDGSSSTVRRCLVGKEAAESRDIGLNIVSTSCRFTGPVAGRQRPVKWESTNYGHATKLAAHPSGQLWFSTPISISDRQIPASWIFEHSLSWAGLRGSFHNQSSVVAWWQFQAKSFGEPWKSVGKELWAPEGVKCRVNSIGAWNPMDVEHWHRQTEGNAENRADEDLGGKVTLVGDAAALIPRFAGLDVGLEKALMDAVSLADELKRAKDGEKTVGEALWCYEEDMRTRAGQMVEDGVELAKAWHNFSELGRRHGQSMQEHQGQRKVFGAHLGALLDKRR